MSREIRKRLRNERLTLHRRTICGGTTLQFKGSSRAEYVPEYVTLKWNLPQMRDSVFLDALQHLIELEPRGDNDRALLGPDQQSREPKRCGSKGLDLPHGTCSRRELSAFPRNLI